MATVVKTATSAASSSNDSTIRSRISRIAQPPAQCGHGFDSIVVDGAGDGGR